MTFEEYCAAAAQAATDASADGARHWLSLRQAFSLEHGMPINLRRYEEHSEAEDIAVDRVMFAENNLIELLLVSRYLSGHECSDPLELGLHELAEKILRAQYVEHTHAR